MKRTDIRQLLSQLVHDLDALADLQHLIDRQRTVEESTMSTLQRLLAERAEIVNLLTMLGARTAPFDPLYKRNYVAAVRSIVDREKLKLAQIARDGDQ